MTWQLKTIVDTTTLFCIACHPGAATCFYAFVGFDSIATSGEEAQDPAYSIPRATLISMTIVTIGYVMVGAALTLVIPYQSINPMAALPEAFSSRGISWAKYVIR